MVHLILKIMIILTTIGTWVRMFRRGGDMWDGGRDAGSQGSYDVMPQ